MSAPETIAVAGGGRAVTLGALRIALAWVDPTSTTLSDGSLINDLDLRLESPGPDSCLAPGDVRPDGGPCPPNSAADNVFYDGNNYGPRTGNPSWDQWSLPRAAYAVTLTLRIRRSKWALRSKRREA